MAKLIGYFNLLENYIIVKYNRKGLIYKLFNILSSANNVFELIESEKIKNFLNNTKNITFIIIKDINDLINILSSEHLEVTILNIYESFLKFKNNFLRLLEQKNIELSQVPNINNLFKKY